MSGWNIYKISSYVVCDLIIYLIVMILFNIKKGKFCLSVLVVINE